MFSFRRMSKKQSSVMHPNKSEFCKKWDVVVGIALVFTAIVTPPEVCVIPISHYLIA